MAHRPGHTRRGGPAPSGAPQPPAARDRRGGHGASARLRDRKGQEPSLNDERNARAGLGRHARTEGRFAAPRVIGIPGIRAGERPSPPFETARRDPMRACGPFLSSPASQPGWQVPAMVRPESVRPVCFIASC